MIGLLEESNGDLLACGFCAVVLSNGFFCVVEVGVRDVRDTVGTTQFIVLQI